MTKELLWSPSNNKNALRRFIDYLNKNNIFNGYNYDLLHKWSINNKKKFWRAVWNFTSIIGEIKDPVVEKENDFINSIFFKNSKLNFTENLIQKKDNSDALVFYSEQGFNRRISWKQLNDQVNKIACYFTKQNIQKGDRIAAILPNIPENSNIFFRCSKNWCYLVILLGRFWTYSCN